MPAAGKRSDPASLTLMGFASFNNSYSTAAWPDHTCYANCCTCGGWATSISASFYETRQPKVNPAARWFDPFRPDPVDPPPRTMLLASKPARRLIHTALTERRRWKRRRRLHELQI